MTDPTLIKKEKTLSEELDTDFVKWIDIEFNIPNSEWIKTYYLMMRGIDQANNTSGLRYHSRKI